MCVCVELLIIVCWGERETMLVVVVLPPNNSTVTLTEAVCPNQQIGYICLPYIVLMLIYLLPIIFVVWLQLFFAVIVAQRSTERERAPTVMSLFRFPFVSLALSTYTHIEKANKELSVCAYYVRVPIWIFALYSCTNTKVNAL